MALLALTEMVLNGNVQADGGSVMIAKRDGPVP